MIYKKINILCSFLVFTFPALSQVDYAGQPGDAIPGEYIVGLKKDMNPERLLSLQKLSPSFLPLFQQTEVKDIVNDRFILVKAKDPEVMEKMLQLKEVAFIEKNRIISAPQHKVDALFSAQRKKDLKKPDDPYWSYQWGLGDYKKSFGIDVLSAWKNSRGSKKVVVAILDSGIETTHEDLKENLWVNKKEKNGEPGVDDDGNGYVDDIHGYDFIKNTGKMIDTNGHGTLVAGIVGAKVNNKIGLAGVNWDVSLMAVRCLGDSGRGGTFSVAKGIFYAVENGAKVINASLGAAMPKSPTLEEAIKETNKKGVIFVAASGNDGRNIDKVSFFPASFSLKYDNVITVGATDPRGKQWRHSNYGKKTVQLFAPGDRIYSTYKGNRYAGSSGTSMSAPYVTGVVALILAKYSYFRYPQVISKILRSVNREKAFKASSTTSGALNARGAVRP